MKLIIDINDEIYRHAQNVSEDSNDEWNAMRAIANGTPIPDNATNGEWVDVKKRLPYAECGESDSVLVCFENETQDVLYFDGGHWRYPTGELYISVNHKNGWHNKVIAWQPLPTPYQKGGK